MSLESEKSADEVLASVEERLIADQGQLAVRTLLDAISGRLLLSGKPLDEWMTGLSQPSSLKLISAFAHYPCFACLNGLEQCETCTGSGFAAIARVCAACAGFGLKRCDFCNGSGLATYNLIPSTIRTNVFAARVSRATRYLSQLLSRSISDAGDAALRRHIQDVNKLLGVLENAVTAADECVAAQLLAPAVGAHFTAICTRSAAAGMARVRKALARLSKIYRDRAALLPPVDADNAESQSEFYGDLAQSRAFESTGLSHTFLTSKTDGGNPTYGR